VTSPVSSLELVAPRSGPEFIEMRGISKRFGGVRALQDVSFSIFAAEIHSLAGENGCGKSTLIKVLSGVHAPDEGEIVLEGKSHAHLSPAASQRFGIQIIYQDLSLFPNLTVAENIAFRIASIVVLMALFFSALSPGFLSVNNLVTLLESYSVMAIMAAGLFVVLVSAGIDISFAAIAAVSQYLVATILVQIGGNWFVAFALSAIFGALLGVLNALLIYYLQALSVIVTISTMTFYFAVLIFVTEGKSIYDLPDWFTATISPLGIPFPVLVAASVLTVTAFLLNQIYGLGGNPEGAKRMGCNLVGLHCFVYDYSGLTAGIAGLVQAHRVEEVVPNALIRRELDVLAAVVLGGASLQGEIGTVSGAVFGIVLLAIIQNGLTLLGVSSYSFGFVTGVIILISVSATAIAAKRQHKKVVGNAV
jgi:simple sugar transport system permease protein